MENKYAGILFLPHHVSALRSRRGRANYAAQFAPFAALAGYEGIVRETERYTEYRPELDENEKMRIAGMLALILGRTGGNDEITVTYFVADSLKPGGAYVTLKGTVKSFDAIKGVMVFTDGTEVPAEDILSVDADIFNLFMFDGA